MKTLIVTGAAGGIGKETLIALSADEVQLVCADPDQARLNTLLQELDALPGIRTPVYSCLEDTDECETVFTAVDGSLQGLVHLAGVFEQDFGFDMEVYHRAIQHNLTNGYTMAGLCAERIEADVQGSMVFISSLAFMRGSFDHVAYSAAKGGLVGMTRALSRKLAPNIRVNAITPGVIDTPMPAHIIADRYKRIVNEIPMRRIGQPEEIASIIQFLMSSGASYITGQVINADGGVAHT